MYSLSLAFMSLTVTVKWTLGIASNFCSASQYYICRCGLLLLTE